MSELQQIVCPNTILTSVHLLVLLCENSMNLYLLRNFQNQNAQKTEYYEVFQEEKQL